MKVSIDITSAVTQRAGVARYTRELFAAIENLDDPPDLYPLAFCPIITQPLPGSVPLRHLASSIRGWRLKMAVRHAARRPMSGPWDGCDVYHAPDMVYPPTHHTPVVATIHDLTFKLFPRYHTRLNGGYLRMAVPVMARSARAIIANSESTRDDVINVLRVPTDRVTVIYPGLSAHFAEMPSEHEIAAVLTRLQLPRSYLLSVGTIEPRKNLAGALKAYGLLKQRGRDLPPLVLVGATGWNPGKLGLDTTAALEGIIRLGFVSDADLKALYRGCSAFVYPSFYEGFGFPVLEAMASGSPVVTSNVSSLPEVTGDAAILVDPASTEAIADGLDRVLFSTEEAARLRAVGPARAALFSYERCAQQTVQVYRLAVGG